MEPCLEPYVRGSDAPLLEQLQSWFLELQRPDTLESVQCHQAPERESVSAFYNVGHDIGELRRHCFGDRCSASWEDPYSCPLGSLVEPPAGNFPQTMGVYHQEWYQQEASGIREFRPLFTSHGQLHRDSEAQVKGLLCVSPVVGSHTTCV